MHLILEMPDSLGSFELVQIYCFVKKKTTSHLIWPFISSDQSDTHDLVLTCVS